MSNLQAILSSESHNTDKIHFYREGVFYKAYERSAYAFVTRVKPFMVKRLFVKSVNQEVLSIGFPTNSLHSYFASDKITERDNEAEVILDTAIVLADFEKWRNGIAVTPLKEMPAKTVITQAMSKAMSNETLIVTKIQTFPIEVKTPLECMLFLSELKKLL